MKAKVHVTLKEGVLDPAGVADHEQIAARGLVRRPGGPDPLVEVLFPAFLDGAPAGPRAPLRNAAVPEILSLWGNDRRKKEI